MYDDIPVDTSSPFTKKLLPYVQDEQLFFEARPFSFSLPYSVADKLDILRKISIRSFITYPDKLESLKAFFKVNFMNPVGSKAPDFTLPSTENELITLSNLKGKNVVFMFVSMTCPPARMQTEQWHELCRKYQSKDIQFLLIYSRERHPGDPGYLEFQHPTNYAEKLVYAKMHAALTDIPVLVDTFDQQVLSLYGKVPNQAFVINREGNIAFKAGWACSEQIESVLDSMLIFESKNNRFGIKSLEGILTE